VDGGKDGREKSGRALFKKPSPGALYKDVSEWLTSGSERSCHIPKQSRTHDTWRKRRRGNLGIHAYPVRLPRAAPLRALPKFRIPQNPLTADQSVRRYLSRDPSLGSSPKFKSSLDRRQEWIKATEVKVDANAERKIADPRYDIIKAWEISRRKSSTPSSLEPRSIRGLMMMLCT